MSRLRAVLRNPYALIAQGFLFGALIMFATQDGREAVATPATAPINASR